MTGANPGIGLRPGITARRSAALAAVCMVGLLWPGALWAEEAQPRLAHRSEAARAHSRWLPLRETLRLLRREPREVILFAHHRDSAYADLLGRRLAANGYRFEAVTAAEGSSPILELLRAVCRREAVPPAVVVLAGSADVAGTPLPQVGLALNEIVASLAVRGANAHRIVLVMTTDGPGAVPDHRAQVLRVARNSGALVADLAGTPSPEAAVDALADMVLAAAAPHPSVFMLLLYPACSLALLWLWRRSRF